MKRVVRWWLVLFLLVPLPSFAANAIDKVDRIQGESVGVADGSTRPLALATAVFENKFCSTSLSTAPKVRADSGWQLLALSVLRQANSEPAQPATLV